MQLDKGVATWEEPISVNQAFCFQCTSLVDHESLHELAKPKLLKLFHSYYKLSYV